ncbi:MAG: hypothetical protein KAH86_09825, partial [Methanosarcinales archaeon]|nr:hypothetical protein [Methanosarcinales archaeon]
GCSVTIQALDADFVAGAEHILFAAEKAIRSWESDKPIANDLGMEILLYASGKRQINKALDMGMHVGNNRVAFIIVSDSPSVVEKAVSQVVALVKEMGGSAGEDISEMAQNDIFGYSEDKKERLQSFFDITELELEAAGAEKICDLVLERVAMVDVMK